MAYFNTTNQKGEVLRRHKEKAETQNEKILAFFKARPAIHFSPTDIWRLLFREGCPLTSVRRSLTNLTNEGALEKTEKTKYGMYGRKEYCWKFKTEKS